MQKMIRFEDCPVGMFLSEDGELCVKTEYGLDAFIVSTGEFFWGGAKSEEQLRQVMVRPVEVEPVKHGRWVETNSQGCWHYDCPFCDDGYATKRREKKPAKYCYNCGAKMDAKED